MYNDKKVSVVFPAYNESKRLPATLDVVLAWLDDQPFDAEISHVVILIGLTYGLGVMFGLTRIVAEGGKVLVHGLERALDGRECPKAVAQRDLEEGQILCGGVIHHLEGQRWDVAQEHPPNHET